MRPVFALLLLLSTPLPARAFADDSVSAFAAADAWVAAHADDLAALNATIWEHPEVGLEEHRAAEALTAFLAAQGFTVEHGIGGMPTAFVARKGSGHPVIGLLAEYDALPGMSQAKTPRREPRPGAPWGGEQDKGHACGHSVFGVASTGAAVAAALAAQKAGQPGTIVLYGTPAEETGIGKSYLAAAGVFDEADAMLHWHAGDTTRVTYASSKAVVSARFLFEGLAAHASRSPEHGRSALDAVELMSVGVNYLREHVRQDTRIHYVVTDGGGQPNVVPPRAEVWYYVRADDHGGLEHVFRRVQEIARGAALMTRTTFSLRIDSDSFELLPNRPLSELLQRHLRRVGPPRFDDAERAFAAETQAELDPRPEKPLADDVETLPDEPEREPASTDVGNVSWRVPTGGLRVACYTLGAPAHSWQIVACTGTSIGEKGMLVAARVLAGATLDLLADEDLRTSAREDFEARVAKGPVPTSLVPAGQAPPERIR